MIVQQLPEQPLSVITPEGIFPVHEDSVEELKNYLKPIVLGEPFQKEVQISDERIEIRSISRGIARFLGFVQSKKHAFFIPISYDKL